VDLATHERNDPTGSHALPGNHYLGFAGLVLLSDGRVLISGGHSQTGFDMHSNPITKTLLASIPEENIPKATIEATPTKGAVPLTVQFSAQVTGGTLPYSYSWDVDGDTIQDETSQSFSHIYTQPGSYQVSLVVKDAADAAATDTVQIKGLFTPVVEGFASPVSGKAPLKVSFNAASSDADGQIVKYQWDFNGDGTFDSTSKKTAATTYTFKKKGSYTAVIQVTDNDGLTARDTVSIKVGTAPVAKTGANPISGPAPLEVTFTGKATDADGKVVLYEWDFDGNGAYDWQKSTDGNVTHTYGTSGVYNATLRVKDNSGLTDLRSIVISVASPPTALPTAYPTSGNIPLKVTFFSNGSDADGSPEYYYWDYDGDGVFDEVRYSAMNGTHTYTKARTYQAVLKVTDNSGLTGTATVTITAIDSNPEGYPTAVAEAFPTVGGRPLTVALKGHASDPDGTIVLYQWDFEGDGAYDWQEQGRVPGPAGTIIDGQWFNSPAFVDIDADGDLDLFVGSANGTVLSYRNDGTKKAPSWTLVGPLATTDGNPIDIGDHFIPSFGDLDGDGDYDLLVGEYYGRVFFYRNTGSVQAPLWTLVGPLTDATGAVIDVGMFSAPALADLDGDGDLDLCLGNDIGTIILYRNTGNRTSPQWTLVGPIKDAVGNMIDVGYNSIPVFARVDGDQDLDLLIGEYNGTVILYQNTGSKSSPKWSLQGPVMDAGGAPVDAGIHSSPALADIDGDGDLDLFVGEHTGKLFFYENSGTKAAPSWVFRSSKYSFVGSDSYARAAAGDLDGDGDLDLLVGDGLGKLFLYWNDVGGGLPSWTPAGFALDKSGNAVAVSNNSSPALADIDGDGDLDLLVGGWDGNVVLFRNTGSKTSPQWTLVGPLTDATAAVIDVGYHSAPVLGDLDGDGDLDLLVGDYNGRVFFYRNDGSPTSAIWTAAGPLTAGGLNIAVYYSAVPALFDPDGDGDLDLLVGESDGKVLFYRNVGDAHAPVWELQPSEYSSINLQSWGTPAFADIDKDGDDDLLMGNQWGFLYFYPTFGCTKHVYGNMGIYNATFKVTDDHGLAATDAVEIRVLDTGSPSVSAVADPVSGNVPLSVALSGKASDPNGTITLYEWDFDGNGVFDWSSGTSPATSHTYDRAGTFAATLRVTDKEGKKAKASVTIKPTAGITTTRTSAFNPSAGQKASVCTTFTDNAKVIVTLVDGAGNPVKTLVSNVSRSKNTQFCDEWNGQNDAGKPVLDGVYYFVIQYTAGGEIFTYDLRKSPEFKEVRPNRTYALSFNPYEDKPAEVVFALDKASEVSFYFWAWDTSRPDPIAPVRTLLLR
jgi:PKD repeat protein